MTGFQQCREFTKRRKGEKDGHRVSEKEKKGTRGENLVKKRMKGN